MKKQRLDKLLVDRQLCETRAMAQRIIQAGSVQVNHQVVDKAGTEVPLDAEILVKAKPPYVSRGGEKLAKALNLFPISVADRIALDGGISTGGFTDCLFQNGAKQVYGVDVGYGQVAWNIRTDPRLVLLERTNIRSLQPETLYPVGSDRPDLMVVDVSFISLVKVLPALWNLLVGVKEAILLVKPQFEVGRDRIGKKGVVRDPFDQADSIHQVIQAARALGWTYQDFTWSPLVGPAGNIEYLLWLSTTPEQPVPDIDALEAIAIQARQALIGQPSEETDEGSGTRDKTPDQTPGDD
jgi:23S rRNA (cytidine1920-2'-O)/16S rRNA (cytidine1409-2'-O)-methyltransferase